MTRINSSLQTAKLQDSLNAVSSSTSTADLAMLALATSQYTSARKIYVDSVNALPNIVSTGIGEGQTLYINDLDTLVFSANNQWLTFDNRVVRTDGPAIEIPANTTVTSTGVTSGGRFGDNTSDSTVEFFFTRTIAGGFTDVCQVSAGYSHTAAVRQNGTLWTWGVGTDGRLGDGTTEVKSSPVSVVGGFTDWCQVSAAYRHTAAVRQNGTLWTWGLNLNGRLGNNSLTSFSSPVSVIGGFTDWCQVSTNRAHTAAVRQNGTLWTWGDGSQGRLGDGTTVDKSSPVSVIGGFTDWCQVSAANRHTAAVRQNGTLWTWGYNIVGQLGNETTISSRSPVSVVGGFTDWCQVSAGYRHTVAIRTNGTLWTWGSNSGRQLGDGTTVNKSSPVSLLGGFTNWCQVSAGFCQTVALRTNGTLWGFGRVSNVGVGDSGYRSSPALISGAFCWKQVSTGCDHTAVVATPKTN
jgi:alpha-tubulin suppressor-like RCC1 family protein